MQAACPCHVKNASALPRTQILQAAIPGGGQSGGAQLQTLERSATSTKVLPWTDKATPINLKLMAAMGWERYHTSLIDSMVDNEKGTDRLAGLGWAVGRHGPHPIQPDGLLQGTVAVVTNPSIDRERERSQFSTRVLLGTRPELAKSLTKKTVCCTGDAVAHRGHPDLAPVEIMRKVASLHGTHTLEDVCEYFGEELTRLALVTEPEETVEQALQRLQAAAIKAVLGGARCLLLDDEESLSGRRALAGSRAGDHRC